MPESSAAQTVALSSNPDFIKASILTASPGNSPLSFSGHAALRLRCDSLAIDRVFSFENSSGGYLDQILKGSEGRVVEIETKDYLGTFEREGREIKEYNLNLTLDEKARLWEVMDRRKTEPEIPFTRDVHCFTVTGEVLEEAVDPGLVNWDESGYHDDTYGSHTRIITADKSPWHYFLVMLPLGDMADKKGYDKGFIYPFIFDASYNNFKIIYPDGSEKPLVAGSPATIVPLTASGRPSHPTPVEVALTVLMLTVAVSAAQYFLHWRLCGRIWDILLWVMVTAGGVMVLIITYAPGNLGSTWNWPLLVFNPLAWVPVVLLRKNGKALEVLWTVYALFLACFAAFIIHISPSIDTAWRLVAVALSMRCLYHSVVRLR